LAVIRSLRDGEFCNLTIVGNKAPPHRLAPILQHDEGVCFGKLGGQNSPALSVRTTDSAQLVDAAIDCVLSDISPESECRRDAKPSCQKFCTHDNIFHS
jgi:hypothetical protein